MANDMPGGTAFAKYRYPLRECYMTSPFALSPIDLSPEAARFYQRVIGTLRTAQVPVLVGGGYAFHSYTTILRHTKDLDIFVTPVQAPAALEALKQAGYRTENKYPHWLAKAYEDDKFVDLIFNSGNGICPVDDEWFRYARPAIILGEPVQLVPIEEMIWQKAFIMERHRYDGSDVVHLLHYYCESLDWDRLLRRFGEYWPVLLSALVLYRFAFPTDKPRRADKILQSLLHRMEENLNGPPAARQPTVPLCRGTLLSLLDYLPAIDEWGYRDARLVPWGNLTSHDIALWTNTFEK
ncbi:MAG: nucleotidyltransferase [Pirellulaceae bacterium]